MKYDKKLIILVLLTILIQWIDILLLEVTNQQLGRNLQDLESIMSKNINIENENVQVQGKFDDAVTTYITTHK